MNERELFKAVAKEHLLNKERIRLNAIRTCPVSQKKMKGTVFMKKQVSAIVLAAALLAATAITVFAVSRFFTPKEVAEKMDMPTVAAAFEKTDSITVNESVTDSGYIVTFLGITSGKNLNGIIDGVDDVGKTYAIVAIENEDGSMDSFYDTLFVSPLIKGLNPGLYNIATLNGGFRGKIIDGIHYRLIECDSIEMFADRGLYLCVSDETSFYAPKAYSFDEKTGEITVNPDYDGLNALFKLPIDASKGDREKSEKYLASIFEDTGSDSEEDIPPEHRDMLPPAIKDAKTVMDTLEPIEASRQNIKPAADGSYEYKYEDDDGSLISTWDSAESMERYKPGESYILMGSGSGNTTHATENYVIITMREDKSLDAVIYRKISEKPETAEAE